jgi:hypothetical protein
MEDEETEIQDTWYSNEDEFDYEITEPETL